MTTFAGSAPFNTMFGQPEDTEMAVDAGKMAQDGDDIDIDLDFEDYGNQDEMMTEEHHEPTYDMVLGDAVVAVEQDEIMTDEDPEEQIFDEEITDAPEEVIEVTDLEFIPDVEYEEEIKSTTNEPLSGLDQQRQFTTKIPEVEIETAEFQAKPETLAATIGTVPEEHTTMNDNVNGTTTPKMEEVEELITWESEDEEDNVDDSGVKVGDSVEEQQSREPPIVEADPVQESKPFESIPTISGQDSVNATEFADNADANKQDALNTTTEYDTTQVNEVEQQNGNSDQETVTGDEHGLTTDNHAQSDLDHKDGVHQSSAHDTTIEEQALEQLHPIIIRYMDEEMSLFPPTIEEEHNFFFLSEKKLAFDNCENLFKAFREVLSESITENESLILSCPGLGLDIHEGIPETSTLSVAQLLHLHLGLSHNDGHDQPSPMLLVLKHQHDVSGRLNQLYALLSSGKGFSALTSQSSSEHTHPNEYTVEAEEFGNEDDGNDIQSTDEAQEGGPSSNDDHKIQNGLATPPREDNLEPENEELDFRSPAAVQKNHNSLKLDGTDGTSTAAHIIQNEEDNTAAQHTEAAPAQDVIDYNDDDDEDDVQEESLTNVEHGGKQQSTPSSDNLSQQVTNHETHSIPPVTKNTDHSNLNDGLVQVTNSESFHEETFGSEDPVVGSAIPEAQPVNGKEDTENSAIANQENTSSSIDGEVPADQETSVPVEAFEEIDYSDDDDEPLPEPVKHTPGRQSPKRSFEDSDEPDRDAKKLRSG